MSPRDALPVDPDGSVQRGPFIEPFGEVHRHGDASVADRLPEILMPEGRMDIEPAVAKDHDPGHARDIPRCTAHITAQTARRNLGRNFEHTVGGWMPRFSRAD